MPSVDNRLLAVTCLTICMLPSAGRPLAAQEQATPPVTPPTIAHDALPHLSRPAVPRPATLVPLYASFGVMQALDMASTWRALAQGGREGNPVVGSTIGSPIATGALKAGATAGIILLSEKIRRRHPMAAIVTMVALNSAYAVAVSHNYAIAR
jgi:Domain of unknown function (DUF5658)